jgi:hypothetical protein
MPIPQFLLDRLKAAFPHDGQILGVFVNLAKALDRNGSGEGDMSFDYVDEDDADKLSLGDLVPTITLSLTRYGMTPPTDPDTIDAEFTIVKQP